MFAENDGGCGEDKEMDESTQWTSWELGMDYIWNLRNVKAQTWSQEDSCRALNTYSRPSIPKGSTSSDSTNGKSKILRKKISRMSHTCQGMTIFTS